MTLVVGDDGVGLPEGMDFRSAKTLGLQLVNTLLDRTGRIDLDTEKGTVFKITVPLSG